jgi:hypothetical protein
MKYSPIFADRWACGRMIYYLEKDLKGGGDGSRGPALKMLRNQLMSNAPISRPSLKVALDRYRMLV